MLHSMFEKAGRAPFAINLPTDSAEEPITLFNGRVLLNILPTFRNPLRWEKSECLWRCFVGFNIQFTLNEHFVVTVFMNTKECLVKIYQFAMQMEKVVRIATECWQKSAL